MSLRVHGSLVALLLAVSGDGVGALSTHRAGADRASAGLSTAELRTCQTAEAESRRAWGLEWQGFASQLLQVKKVAAALANATGKAPAAKGADPLASLKGFNLNLNPKSIADLAPALGMLKSVYEDGKAHIGELNAKEKASKDRFVATEANHDAKLASIAARLKNQTLSKEMATMGEKDEALVYNYWKRVRDLQHRQFHTALKLQHATMMKVKKTIDMYDRTISGKEDKKKLAKEFATRAGVVPEVVFLQEAGQDLQQFCQTTLAGVKRAQAELAQ